jgi:hypothetical protein
MKMFNGDAGVDGVTSDGYGELQRERITGGQMGNSRCAAWAHLVLFKMMASLLFLSSLYGQAFAQE